MDIFDSELRSTLVYLWTATDIVQYSFIVQNSITPLNLELCQRYQLWNGYRHSYYPSFSHSKVLISTEKKCRKVYAHSRRILHTLHLDLSIRRKGNLKSEPQHKIEWIDMPERHIERICIYENFYIRTLSHFIQQACNCPGHNLKIVKWLINFNGLEKSEFDQLSNYIMDDIIKCLHHQLHDSEFVMECFRKFHVVRWLINKHQRKPIREIFLFYQHYRMVGNTRNPDWINDFIELSPSFSNLRLIDEVLKFRDTPNFCEFLGAVLKEFSRFSNSLVWNIIVKRMSLQRLSLLLLVFWIYLNKTDNPSQAAEYLRLIWNSIPDSLFSFQEIEATFKKRFSQAEIVCFYKFYSEAVGGLPSDVEPRSLKHYCRTTIRRTLHGNRHWLPKGIRETDLPKKLQSYLNLEE